MDIANQKYKYQGIELTPIIFADLMVQLLDGKQFDRRQAVDIVLSFHKENGGMADKENYIPIFKKATAKLKDKGLTHIGYRDWRLCYAKNEVQAIPKKETRKSEHRIIGIGAGSVYVYYYDTYRLYAETNGKSNWACKIGVSMKEAIQRISEQTGTSLPEPPIVGLEIRCNDPRKYEKILHEILKLKKRHIKTAPGSEWFETSPKEVEEIYKKINAIVMI